MNNIDNFEALKLNNISIIDNFLAENECRDILEKITLNPFWRAAKVATRNSISNREYLSNYRTGFVLHECNFGNLLKSKTDSIKSLLSKAINIELSKLENWQITRYESGDSYNFHTDCGCWEDHPFGEREKTILIYLFSPKEGGETYFRALNHYVKPIEGRLVFWDNLLRNGNCNYAMIHASLRVRLGTKITLNTWIRQNDFINTL